MLKRAGLTVATGVAFGIVLLLAIPAIPGPSSASVPAAPGPTSHPAASASHEGLVPPSRSVTTRPVRPTSSPSDPWSSITTASAPTQRGAPACATDPSTNVTYCYGGAGVGSAVVDNDTWSYVNGTWTNLTALLSPSPGPVGGGMMVYDPSQSAFFLFGGLDGYGGNPEANTWKFTGTKWTNLTATAGTAPSPRWGESFDYDPALGYSLLFGGWDNLGAWSDTWSFDAGKWSDVSATVGTAPTARAWGASAYDPIREAIVLTGGAGFGSSPIFDDTWELQSVAGQPSWSNITTSVGSPPARRMAGMVFDPALGGDLLTGGDAQAAGGSWPNYQDVWVLADAGWIDLTSSITSFPAGRFAPAMFWDPSIGVAILFGGCTSLACGTALNDTWEFSEGFTANLSAPSSALVNSTVSFSGAAYGAPLGSRPEYSYNYTGLPPGCRSANASAISCRPSATGHYDVRVNVTDLAAPNGSADLYAVSPVASIWVVQQVTGSFSVSRTTLDVGQSFWINVSVSGGGGSLSYSYSGLPQGCTSKNVSSLDCAPATAGSASIIALARDSLGNVVADQLNVTISPRLGVAGTESTGLLDVGLPVYLNATATGGSGGTTLTWSLPGQGCPTPATATLVCVLDAPGSLVPSIVARDSNGANATLRLGTIVVEPDPQVSYTAFPLAGASPLVVTFTTSTQGGVGPFLYEWEFGDGTSASFANGSHTFVVPGVHTGHLWLNDSLGLGTETTVRVAVETPPTVLVSTLPGVAEVGFDARLFANVTGGAAPFSFTWSALPAGCPYLNASELNCTATSPGTYQVGVLVRDTYGVLASRSAFFTVVPTLAVNISLRQGTPSDCPSTQPVTFAAIVAGGAAPFSYVWAFGDGGESSQPEADHNYTLKGGTYMVGLEVSDAAGVHRFANRTLAVVLPTSTCSSGPVTAGVGLPWTDIGIGAVAGAVAGAGVTAVLLRRRDSPPENGPEIGPETASEPTGPFWQDPDAPSESGP